MSLKITILNAVASYPAIFVTDNVVIINFFVLFCIVTASLLNYVLYAPSCLTCLTHLRALHAFVPSRLCPLRALLTRLTCAPCAPYLRTLKLF